MSRPSDCLALCLTGNTYRWVVQLVTLGHRRGWVRGAPVQPRRVCGVASLRHIEAFTPPSDPTLLALESQGTCKSDDSAPSPDATDATASNLSASRNHAIAQSHASITLSPRRVTGSPGCHMSRNLIRR